MPSLRILPLIFGWLGALPRPKALCDFAAPSSRTVLKRSLTYDVFLPFFASVLTMSLKPIELTAFVVFGCECCESNLSTGRGSRSCVGYDSRRSPLNSFVSASS